ncbi:MAG TPA: M64 family metallopeptidase [Longimicrobiales bacterium]|nr:M64 family metallopeptidase [Longimicrobiales bacterium]
MRFPARAGCLLAAVLSFTAPLAAAPALNAQSPGYDAHFGERTMRVDYYHTGGLGQEIVSLDRVVADGAWPGSRTQLVDETNLGAYRFEVRDAASDALLYSRGFASVFGEWVTTAEAGVMHRTFHESLRFPWPKQPVTVVLQRRGEPQQLAPGAFEEVWRTTVDPASRFVNRADAAPRGRVLTFQEHGAAASKVDLVLVAEGYTEAEAAKFETDARRLLEALFREEPFRSRRTDFNVRGLFIPAAASGGHRARADQHRRTHFGTEYNIFDSERYVLTQDNRSLRDAISTVPYEFIEVLVNDAQYGGGGIFNAHSTVAVDSEFAEYVFVHEFGHHFAGLADEYYTSDVAYQTGAAVKPEPWERNTTALHDPARLKWRDLVTPGTPLPTPWEKAEYERHGQQIRERRQALVARNAPQAEFDRLFAEQQAWETAFFQRQKYHGHIGAFEGAGYEVEGLYRPEIDCVMFSRNPVGFCEVCRRALLEVIQLYTS